MTRGQMAFTWLVIGAALATIGWWWAFGEFDWSAWQAADPRRPRTDSSTELAAIRDRLDQISRKVAERPEPVRVVESATPAAPGAPDPALAEIQARLTAIEAALSRPAGRDDARLAHPKPPEPKAKDQDLVVELYSKGEKEPGANAKQYWGWAPQEIHQALGKPDGTQFDPKTGRQDWFYVMPGEHAALQVRFEAGFVIGVWP
jgi:hypothetical protein